MILVLPLPPSTNRCWRTIVKGDRAVVISSAAYRTWLKDAAQRMNIERAPCYEGDVRASLVVYFKDRRRDADSAIKPTLDALQGWGYKNDRQVREIHLIAKTDKSRPRVEIELQELA